jgi:sodium-dependent dicarboxylate transporter 2/3/5
MELHNAIDKIWRLVRRYNRYIKVGLISLIALVIAMLPTELFGIPGLDPIQQRVIAIFIWAACMWIVEAVPAWTTSLLIIVIMLLTVSDSSINPLIKDLDKKMPQVEGYRLAVYTGDTTQVARDEAMEMATLLEKEFPKQKAYVVSDSLSTTCLFGDYRKINEAQEAMYMIKGKKELGNIQIRECTISVPCRPLSYKTLMNTFANPTVMLFMGGFILALVASKSGVDVSMARAMLKPFGSKPSVVLFGFMLVTAAFSMFVSNTATAAMMLTFLAPVLRQLPPTEKGTAALALAIPIGANIGGLATPIGTPPNGIALQYINGELNLGVDFGEWMMVMTPLMLAILVISWILLRFMYPFTAKKVSMHIVGGAKKGWRTYVIYGTLAVTILLWMFEKVTGINSYVVALFPIGVFAITRIIKSSDLKDIDWACLWMVAGGFALGEGMSKTGLADNLVQAIPFGSWPAILVLIGGGLICWLLSQFISNSAATALMVPIMIAVGRGIEGPLGEYGGIGTLLVGVAMAASFAMSLPISTPPNAIAYSTGLIKTKQMFITGMAVGVISLIIGYLLIVAVGRMGYFG